MSTPSHTSGRNGKASKDVFEVLSVNLLFLPSTFSIVRPELAPLLFHSQFSLLLAFWLQWLGLCQLETSSTGRLDVRPALSQAGSRTAVFCMFCCPEKSNSLSKITFFQEHSTLPPCVRTHNSMATQKGPSSLSALLVCLFTFVSSFSSHTRWCSNIWKQHIHDDTRQHGLK